MKLINANIKNKEEALSRMINGEVFYYEDVKIYYSNEFLEEVSSLFVIEYPDGSIEELLYILDSYSLYEIQADCKEDLCNNRG